MEKKCGCKKEDYQKPTVEKDDKAFDYAPANDEKAGQEPYVGFKVCLDQPQEK